AQLRDLLGVCERHGNGFLNEHARRRIRLQHLKRVRDMVRVISRNNDQRIACSCDQFEQVTDVVVQRKSWRSLLLQQRPPVVSRRRDAVPKNRQNRSEERRVGKEWRSWWETASGWMNEWRL